ncbi:MULTISPECIES: mercuric reductase [Acetobacteraceae]|jgi:mercuric ion transport protein|uniref:Mercury ion transport protein n=6 Tax=Acetobacteraceae TaxID=433 RepID=A0A511XPZ6_9PROT|nr:MULTISPECIES: mercuric reductase [Acetobacteraceae]KXV00310.1 mercuric reductase [Gluconobacter potus]MBB3883184.1 mercuric ion transport protein [Acetobacter oeni]MBB6457874.1 mercuric ion transport protein [Acetobacter lovaniensis]MBF0851930.1 mercuric reductase [Gluconobacter sp. R75690]MBF0875572.1 mercuric reductase [Gluconobacter cerevisiae]
MSQPLQPRPKGIGAASLTLGGIAAAFAVASCCALPILLTSAGLGVAWLSGIAVATAPFRTPLLIVGALFLLFGAVLLGRQQVAASRCGPDGVCTPPAVRIFTFAGLLVGVVLLYLGYRYA